MIPELHLAVLRRLCARLADGDIVWAVTGSAGLALQGVPVEVHDLDLQADAAGIYEIEQRLAEHVAESVHWRSTEKIGSHLGVLEINGLKVELMGGLQKRLPSGEWEPPVDVAALRRFVEVGELRIPVLPLEHEHQAYLLLGRPEKAALIKRTMDEGNAQSVTSKT